MVALTLILVLSASQEDVIIEKLGHDDFDVREKATQQLLQIMDFPMYVRLRELRYNDNGDAEIQARVQMVVAHYEAKLVSTFKVDLGKAKMYPCIDHIIPRDYKLNGPWEGWSQDDFEQNYLLLAHLAGAERDGPPKFTNYRRATEIFMQHRVCHVAYPLLRKSTTEDKFHLAMKDAIVPVQQDFNKFVDNEVAFYARSEGALNYFLGISEEIKDFFTP